MKATLEYYQSDKYVEQRAREDLNLRRPDEEVLIPIAAASDSGFQDAELSTPGSTQSGASGATTSRSKQANWQKWLSLFSPAP